MLESHKKHQGPQVQSARISRTVKTKRDPPKKKETEGKLEKQVQMFWWPDAGNIATVLSHGMGTAVAVIN